MENKSQPLVIVEVHKGCILALTAEEYMAALKRGKAIRRQHELKKRLGVKDDTKK